MENYKKGRVYELEQDGFWYNAGMVNVRAYYSGKLPVLGDIVAVKGEIKIEQDKKVRNTDDFHYAIRAEGWEKVQ